MVEFNFIAPLLFAFGIIGVFTISKFWLPLDRQLTRIALAFFGSYTREQESVAEERAGVTSPRVISLRSAHIPTTYRVYASKTLLYAAMLALAGSIIGIYVVLATFYILGIPSAVIRSALPEQLGFL
ncbi:MAG: type II secretion protein F, partial [Halobacteriaceae archaeon]